MMWLGILGLVVCAGAMAMLVVAAYKVLPARPPKHVHEWSRLGLVERQIFERSSDKMPCRIETDISGVCKTCGEPLMRTVKGKWSPANTTTRSASGAREGGKA